jgi:YkoY family integral membrane protein
MELPFHQIVETKDLASVVALVVLEGLLSGDNALVLAIMVRHLPREEQKKALLFGLGGAFFFRLLAILFATIILKQWWLQAIGAAYLILISIKHFVGAASDKEVKPVGKGFWPTVVAVELTDIAFAVDSVLAGITFINNDAKKIWVVLFGAVIGIVLLRFAAGAFVRILDRYPVLDHVAYALVAWVGVKLAFLAGNSYSASIPHMHQAVFWAVLLTIAIGGTLLARKYAEEPTKEESDSANLVEDAQDLEYDDDQPTRDTV